MRTLIGLFENLNEARATLDDLAKYGIPPEQVSVISESVDGTPIDDGPLHLRSMNLPDGHRIVAQGPLIPMLTPSTAASSGDLIVSSLVRMGVPQSEAIQYVDGIRHGYTLEAVTVDDSAAQVAYSVMQQHGISDQRGQRTQQQTQGLQQGTQRTQGTQDRQQTQRTQATQGTEGTEGTQGTQGQGTQRTEGGEMRIPVIEEQLRVGKREVAAGGVRVSTYVTTLPVEETVTLREEHVDVERRAADRPADEQAFREQSIEVTATSEEPVVGKESRIVEEVVVRKDVAHEQKTIQDQVRRTDVQVEPLKEDENVFDANAYRGHFDQTYGAMTDNPYRYEQVLPAYQYGHSLRSNDRYVNKDWAAIESNARTDWESKEPGTWDKFKNAIKHAWERAKD